MALRVLLADESSTIKKAIQMALSDLGVEVKSVPSGLDVLTVSRTYLPDLIFADILLTKKNGYEVCQEIKNDVQLQTTPVILMWSSFMQLDHKQFMKVRADASLEKPFDSEALRNIVEKFAPKTSSFPLKDFLNHPKMPDFEESDTFVRQKTDYLRNQTETQVGQKPIDLEDLAARPAKSKTEPNVPNNSPNFNPNDEDDHDDFTELELKKPAHSTSDRQTNKGHGADQQDDWSASSADQFIVETESYGDFEEVKVLPTEAPPNSAPQFQKRIQEQLQTYMQDTPITQNKVKSTTTKHLTDLDEQLLKEEVKMMAEKICWQILPDITEKIVREELHKLLQGIEKNI